MKYLTSVLIILTLSALNPGKLYAQRINEFQVDENPEWVELFNASGSSEYLKDYYLDDDTDFNSDSGNSPKRILTNIVLTSQQYPYIELDSFLNNGSDYVVIFDNFGNLIDSYNYTSSPGNGLTQGRSPDQTGNYSYLQTPTKGSPNSLTKTPSPQPTHSPLPTSSPTPTPIQTISPTATPLKTLKPTPQPTESPVPEETPESETQVLSAQATETPTSTPEIKLAGEQKRNLIPYVFIASGLLLSLGALGAFFIKLRYNGNANEYTQQ